MKIHTVKVYPSKIKLSKKNQLAWKLAEISSDNAKLNKKSVEMAIKLAPKIVSGLVVNILIFFSNATNIAEEIVAKNLSARSVEILVRNKKGPQKSGHF